MTHWNAGRKITLPYNDWPKPLQQEWDRAFPRNSFAARRAPDPKARLISDKYLENILETVERFRYFQVQCNPEAVAWGPAKWFVREDVETFVADLKLGRVVQQNELEPTTIESYVDRLLAAARRLDPYPHGKYKWLERLARKNRPARQAPPPPPLALEDMLDLGFEAMAEARAALGIKKRRRGAMPRAHVHIVYRDALLLVLLALMGLRIGETLTLAQGVSLLINEDPLLYVVDLVAAVTKMRKAKTRDVPRQLNEAMSFYRNHVRPAFPGAAETQKFWLGRDGVLGYQGAYAGLTRLTERRAQKRANATDIRHAIADASRLRGDSEKSTRRAAGAEQPGYGRAVLHRPQGGERYLAPG